MSQETKQGYDINHGRATRAIKPNAYILDMRPKKSFINPATTAAEKKGKPLWVYDLRTNFSLVGATAQSVRTRSFFAHNMAQPSLSLDCQFEDQGIYADTVEYIRSNHWDLSSLMRLYIQPNNTGVATGDRMRGSHGAIYVEGYVKSVRRSHKRFEYAPEMSFDFVISNVLQGPGGYWKGEPATVTKMATWNALIRGKKFEEGVRTLDPGGPITTIETNRGR